MLARKQAPKLYEEWNRIHHSPFGRPMVNSFKRFLPASLYHRLSGPFSWLLNSSTRKFEYPWAFYAVPVSPGMRVLEIGGGISGFQFILDRAGCNVVNVDPGLEAGGVGWPCDQATIATMNRIYGTSVKLLNTTIDKTQLEPAAFDCIYSLSTIEHMTGSEAVDAIRMAYHYLKPGGFFVMTVDLFLNLKPFTSRGENEYGTNVDIKLLIEESPFTMIKGDRAELYGFPEFDTDKILGNLELYLLGYYPSLAQCVVLQKQCD